MARRTATPPEATGHIIDARAFDPRPVLDRTIVSDGENVTAIALTYRSETWHDVVGVGTARRRPGDRRDNDVGLLLAEARALRGIADRLEQIAEDRMSKFPPNTLDRPLLTGDEATEAVRHLIRSATFGREAAGTVKLDTDGVSIEWSFP